MALPKYTRRERKPAREHLPKGAYVVRIVEAKIREWPSKDQYIEIAYDIAEGDYAGFYNKQYQEAKQSGENAAEEFLFHNGSKARWIEQSPCEFAGLCENPTNISYHTKGFLSMENSLSV